MCEHCGGKVKVTAHAHPCARGIRASMHIIASIEDPQVIEKILGHIKKEEQPSGMPSAQIDWLQHERAPPRLH